MLSKIIRMGKRRNQKKKQTNKWKHLLRGIISMVPWEPSEEIYSGGEKIDSVNAPDISS